MYRLLWSVKLLSSSAICKTYGRYAYVTAFKRKLESLCSGFNTIASLLNHLRPLLCYMLCYVMLCYVKDFYLNFPSTSNDRKSWTKKIRSHPWMQSRLNNCYNFIKKIIGAQFLKVKQYAELDVVVTLKELYISWYIDRYIDLDRWHLIRSTDSRPLINSLTSCQRVSRRSRMLHQPIIIRHA